MASKKPAITGLPQGIDDIIGGVEKAVNRYGAMRRLGHGVVKSGTKAAKGSKLLDIYGSAYKIAKATEKSKNIPKGKR